MKKKRFKTPLARVRWLLRLTLDDVAAMSGVSKGQLSRYERDIFKCAPALAQKIVGAFKKHGLPPEAADFSEMHIIYPARYASWLKNAGVKK